MRKQVCFAFYLSRRSGIYQFLPVFTSIFTSFYMDSLRITNSRKYVRSLLIRLEHRFQRWDYYSFHFLELSA
jgi:hypothetical protein